MDDAKARALLAGTLALMTHFADCQCPSGAALDKLSARWSRLQSTLH